MSDRDTTVEQLRGLLRAFVDERAWSKYHDAKNLSMSIAIEAAELMEHFQWVRNEALSELLEDPERRSAVVDELADVGCYVLALANVLGVDLSDAIQGKMAKNARKYPVDAFHGHYYKPIDKSSDGV